LNHKNLTDKFQSGNDYLHWFLFHSFLHGNFKIKAVSNCQLISDDDVAFNNVIKK